LVIAGVRSSKHKSKEFEEVVENDVLAEFLFFSVTIINNGDVDG
jgi:hypothetical protein